MITLSRRAFLAAMQWLGFIDPSAASGGPHAAEPSRGRSGPVIPGQEGRIRADDTPPEVHISLGLFVLTSSPSRA